jgi:hypothetical protein
MNFKLPEGTCHVFSNAPGYFQITRYRESDAFEFPQLRDKMTC